MDDAYRRETRPRPRGLAAVLILAVAVFAARASHACAADGALAGLLRYAGRDALGGAGQLDTDPAVQGHLRRLPDNVREHLQRNLDVRGPVDLVSCHLVLEGNAEHQGGLENAILDVNLYSGAVTVGLLSAGRITIYLDADRTAGSSYDAAVPRAVRTWAAVAASGFRLVEQAPAGARVVRPGSR